jgi:hypothetical protein
VDEREYREISQALSSLCCPFEKAILTGHFGCERSTRINIAEREVVECASAEAQRACLQVAACLQRGAKFALKLTGTEEHLPHIKAMKLQCGGLLGLQHAVVPESGGATAVTNVYEIIKAVYRSFGNPPDLPLATIVRRIACHAVRRGCPRAGA